MYTLPGEETLKELANIHFPGNKTRRELSKKLGKICSADNRKSKNDWINPDKVKAAFEAFKARKSPG